MILTKHVKFGDHPIKLDKNLRTFFWSVSTIKLYLSVRLYFCPNLLLAVAQQLEYVRTSIQVPVIKKNISKKTLTFLLIYGCFK